MRQRKIKLAALALTVFFAFTYSLLARAAQKYSRFNHGVPQHKRACDACHKFPSKNWKDVRKGDDAFPDITDYPEHSSCIDCHRQQFFKGSQPVICTVCHTDPGPRNSSRYPFPSLGQPYLESKKGLSEVPEFGVLFPHDKHIEIVGQDVSSPTTRAGFRLVLASYGQKKESKEEESDPKSCAVCHKTYQPQGGSDEEFVTRPPKGLAENGFWLKRGAFKTSPMTHASCFTCHSQDSGLSPAPDDCAACHKLLAAAQRAEINSAHDDFDPKLAAAMGVKDAYTLIKWSRREAARFRHEWLPHAGLSCNACHDVTRMNTLDEETKRVPVKSCGGEGSGCHIEASADGVLNSEVAQKQAASAFECSKCHVQNGKKPVPETHINALPKK